ncbi:MAG: SDR family oxidoreductase [bacterium]|jgi:short-subunit dehydrogenase|nr:SDR family oxidoreductase [Gammaproteobacteria bacterium]HIL85884.1 SDR family oxidoreductase [Pseudomonadales bacterium]
MSRGTALITGASSGIGEAFVRLFAAEGFDLVLTARREEKLQELAADLPATTKIVVLPGDLSTTAGITTFCESVSGQSLEIDVLVNNAGMMVEQGFANLTTEQIERTITLNITALTQLIHQFLPAMKARKSGRILNVASVAAFHPVPGMDIYAATKAYVLSFSEALAENLRDTGISVTALCPGLTDTDMVDTSVAGAMPTFMISQPDEVARSGFDALMNREVICIPGNVNRLALAWSQHQPRWLVRGLGGLANKLTPQR